MKHKALSFLSFTAIIDARVGASSTASSSRGVQPGELLRRTGFQLQQNKRIFRRSAISCAIISSGHIYVNPSDDATCNFGQLGGSVWRELNEFGRLRQTLVHIQIRKLFRLPSLTHFGRRSKAYLVHIQIRKLSRWPSSTPTQPFRPLRFRYSFVWAAKTGYKSDLVELESTQLRLAQTRNTGSLPVPAPVADQHSNTRFGANTSGDDCTSHRLQKYTKPSTKPMALNGEHVHTLWVSHSVAWADLLLCHPYYCQRP